MADQNLALVAKQLNESVAHILSQKDILGFQKAYMYSEAITQLRALLTPEYMKPIMALQGNKLGFRTDKDRNKDGTKGTGYPEEIIKDCLIEAVLTGLQPYGNQFNIIAGNMYPTKEGIGSLLEKYEGLKYLIVPELPRVKGEAAAVVMIIKWNINNGGWNEQNLDVAIRVNDYMGTDAIIGKATRKARAWLYSTITGSEISDGDVSDNDAPKTIPITAKREPIGSIEQTNNDKEKQRVIDHIANSKTLEELNQVIDHIGTYSLQTEFANKTQQLSNE